MIIVSSPVGGGMIRNISFQFFDSLMQFSTNLDTTNLKIFLNHDGIYSFEWKFNKISEEKNCFEEATEIEEDVSLNPWG